MKKKVRTESWFDKLSPAEKAVVFEEASKISSDDPGEELSAEDIKAHRKAGLNVGRPKVGKGIKRINLSVEKGLLAAADKFAQRRGVTRAKLVADSLKAYMGKAS